jgi:dihydrofolate reductase
VSGAAGVPAAAPVALIVAMTREGLMGRGLQLPWSWPEDLKHFKRTTKDHVVIMGRRTWDSLNTQFGGPLPHRTNVVVSRGAGGEPDGELRDGARWFRSLDDALAWGSRAPHGHASPELFVLGGAELFRVALERSPRPERLVVTWVPDVPSQPGDTFFPFRPARAWVEAHYAAVRTWTDTSGQLEFVDYARR